MQNFDAYNRDLTLDPADWAPLNILAHQMVDDMLRFLEDSGFLCDLSEPFWIKVNPFYL